MFFHACHLPNDLFQLALNSLAFVICAHARTHSLTKKIMGFDQETIGDIMRVVVAILYAGNMSFSETNHGETCILDEDGASLTVADLLGVSYENLAASLTKRVLIVREGNITKNLNAKQAYKAAEGLLKSIYGANFDYIVNAINRSIRSEQQAKDKRQKDTSAYIGVLDIFGFETFQVNSFEQLCINYTNETLQQHFNQHVFKMEQQVIYFYHCTNTHTHTPTHPSLVRITNTPSLSLSSSLDRSMSGKASCGNSSAFLTIKTS